MAEEKQEENKNLVRRIVELFQSQVGYTSTPLSVSKILESDYKETALAMLLLENKKMRILYSAWNKSEMYGLNPSHLWKRTITEAEAATKYLKYRF